MKRSSLTTALTTLATLAALVATLAIATGTFTSCQKEFEFNTRTPNMKNISGSWDYVHSWVEAWRVANIITGEKEIFTTDTDHTNSWRMTLNEDGTGSYYMYATGQETPITWEMNEDIIYFSGIPDVGTNARVEQLLNNTMVLHRKGTGDLIQSRWTFKRL